MTDISEFLENVEETKHFIDSRAHSFRIESSPEVKALESIHTLLHFPCGPWLLQLYDHLKGTKPENVVNNARLCANAIRHHFNANHTLTMFVKTFCKVIQLSMLVKGSLQSFYLMVHEAEKDDSYITTFVGMNGIAPDCTHFVNLVHEMVQVLSMSDGTMESDWKFAFEVNVLFE